MGTGHRRRACRRCVWTCARSSCQFAWTVCDICRTRTACRPSGCVRACAGCPPERTICRTQHTRTVFRRYARARGSPNCWCAGTVCSTTSTFFCPAPSAALWTVWSGTCVHTLRTRTPWTRRSRVASAVAVASDRPGCRCFRRFLSTCSVSVSAASAPVAPGRVVVVVRFRLPTVCSYDSFVPCGGGGKIVNDYYLPETLKTRVIRNNE